MARTRESNRLDRVRERVTVLGNVCTTRVYSMVRCNVAPSADSRYKILPNMVGEGCEGCEAISEKSLFKSLAKDPFIFEVIPFVDSQVPKQHRWGLYVICTHGLGVSFRSYHKLLARLVLGIPTEYGTRYG